MSKWKVDFKRMVRKLEVGIAELIMKYRRKGKFLTAFFDRFSALFILEWKFVIEPFRNS